MPWGGWRLDAGLARERLAGTAGALLAARVAIGLLAWLLFNVYFLDAAERAGPVTASFVFYLLGNLALVLRYRGGARGQPALLLVDVAVNVLPFAAPLLLSGTTASPLLLLLGLHAVIYHRLFGTRAAALCLASSALLLAVIAVLEGVGLVRAVALADLPGERIAEALSLSAGGFLIGLAALLAGLGREGSVVPRPRPAPRERNDADGAPAAVANALLGVSEVVSRLTRLEDILDKVVAIAPRSVGVDSCSIALWAEDSGLYTDIASAGLDGASAADPATTADFEWVRRLGHCAVVPLRGPRSAGDPPSELIAPLRSGERFFGVIRFSRRHADRPFTQRDFSIADGIARQTAVALERARLVEESRRLVRALESTSEAVLITDAQRRVIFVNPALLETLGYRAEEVLGRDVLELAGAQAPIEEELRGEVMRRGWRGETVAYRKDGAAVPILLHVSLIRDDAGRVQGGVAILEDISAEKTFQQQMQRADRLAAVGEMAAGIAHEINNALSGIFGQTEKREQLAPEQMRAALHRIDTQARRIGEIVHGVLGFARPRPPQPEPLDLAATAAQTLLLVQHDLRRAGVDVETHYEADLPPALADPLQVQQVLLNLFSNAIQAMTGAPQGKLLVEVLGAEERLAVRVTDSGPGIPADILPRIFDPFFSTKREGTGLGLSVSYAIARAHGGDLVASNAAARGATFTLLMPIAREAGGAVLRRVMLVDDDREVAESIADMLASEGLQVVRAASAAEALRLAEDGAWDAIFLDVRLPDRSGPEVFAELERTHPELAPLVVFVTGGVWRSESRLRQQLPSQPVLPKPCTQEQVRDVLRGLRRQRRQAA